MTAFKKILILFFVSLAIQAAFVTVFHIGMTGYLKDAITKHEHALKEGPFPAVQDIDMEHGDWVGVVRFERTVGQIGFVVSILFNFFIAYILIVGGVSNTLVQYSEKKFSKPFLSRSLYLVLFTLISTLVSLPSLFSGYYIGIIRGTSTITPLLLVKDFFLGFALSTLFTIIAFLPFFWLMGRFKKTWWIFVATFLSVVGLVMNFLGPVVISPLFNTYIPLSDQVLSQKIITLANDKGVSIDRVFVEDMSSRSLDGNAYVVGIGNTKRIVIGDTLLKNYSHDEIIFIVAHELGHYVKQHVLIGIAVETLFTFFSFWILFIILQWVTTRWGEKPWLHKTSVIALFPIISVILSLISLCTSPVEAVFHRTLEHQADVVAVQTTHNPQAGITAFKKMTYTSFIDPNPPRLLHLWFDDHPTIKERIDFFQSSSEKK